MAPAAVAQRLLTFAFTDIVGSTRLWERVPEAAHQALARHNEIVRACVRANRGTVFKTVGDACCCVFSAPQEAVRAAIAMQRALPAEGWAEAVGELQIRIGIHSGPAIAEAGDYLGPTLNRVARLMSAAHGGQILISSTTAQALEDALAAECVLVDLGAHRLRDLAEPQHLFQVNAEGLPAQFAPPASLDAQPNNLPSQLSTFIGRRYELERLRELLARNRLVTICGLGGAGKTRLGLQVAAETIGRYADGSWIVRLEDVADSSLVVPAIASALNVGGVAGEALSETVIGQLRTRRMFLLLDNAEHVLASVAEIVRLLLAACPGVTVLATSREPLHVTGEQVLRIGRMPEDDAATLFVDRANLAASDGYIRHICEELDGLPLAIEIAAGRIGTLSTKQLDTRLQAMLPALVSKDASRETRHRTLQATIDWSYRLLNPKERRFFAFLSAFEGGFTLEACEGVAWAGEEDDPAYALLDALVDKSFVVAEPDADSMRYRLLESLHRFAAEKLEQFGEAQPARELHFAYFKAMADRWGTWTDAEEERAYLRAFAAEIPNLRAALAWGIRQADPDPAFELLLNVARYWQQHCSIAEARSWLQRACGIAQAAAHTLAHAKLLRRAATFATIEDDYGAARDLTERALTLFEELHDTSGTAEALHNLAVIEQRSGSEDRAYGLYVQALRMFEQSGHEIGIITALYNLAQTSKRRGDAACTKRYLERGMSLCASPEHADRLATFWTLRGELALQERSFEEASQALHRALVMKRTLDDRHDQVEVLCKLAVLEIRRGDTSAATRCAREALTLARELDIPSLFVGCFEVFAAISLQAEDLDGARQAVSLAKGIRTRLGYVYGLFDELEPDLAPVAGVAPATAVSREDLAPIIDGLANGTFPGPAAGARENAVTG